VEPQDVLIGPAAEAAILEKGFAATSLDELIAAAALDSSVAR
jgi:AcrR family transcriptional regulator